MNGKDLYLRLLGYVLPYRGMFALSLLATVVFAATEPAMPALMKPLLDETFVARDTSAMIRLPLLLLLLFLVRGAAGFTGNTGMQWVATRVVMDLRTAMFDRLLTLPVYYFDNHSSGNLIARHTFHVQRVMEAATSVVVTLIKDSLIVIGLLAWAIYINWQLSLILLAIMPPTAWVIRLVSRRLRKLSRSLQDTVGELTRVLQETFGSSREIKIFGGADYEKHRFREFNDRIRRYHVKASRRLGGQCPARATAHRRRDGAGHLPCRPAIAGRGDHRGRVRLADRRARPAVLTDQAPDQNQRPVAIGAGRRGERVCPHRRSRGTGRRENTGCAGARRHRVSRRRLYPQEQPCGGAA